MKREYSQDERYEIKRVLTKVFEVLESTTNDIDITIGYLGVQLAAHPGAMETSTDYAIHDDAAYDDLFTAVDADRMIAELSVLEHFNKRETSTTEEE